MQLGEQCGVVAVVDKGFDHALRGSHVADSAGSTAAVDMAVHAATFFRSVNSW